MLRGAEQSDARLIGEIYAQAFPGSIELFFRDKPEGELEDLLELTFTLVFLLGAEGVIAQVHGEPAGYCLYSSDQTPAPRAKREQVLPVLGRLVGKTSLVEGARLAQNQLLGFFTRRKKRRVPKPQAQILSIAVLPRFQGQGLGTLLLHQVLAKLSQQSVGLDVRANNPAARRLYAQAGFEEYGSKRDLGGTWLMLYRPPQP